MDKQERWYSDHMPLKGQVVADVGANVGRLSQFFWDVGESTNRVVSLEPLPENLRRIRARIAASRAANWRVEACAVSACAGELTLRPTRSDEHGWNSMVVATAPRAGDLTVPCKPLTELCPDATIVKVDIEGHEYAVLDQALGELARVHTWTVELHMVAGRPLGRVVEQFLDHGFSVAAATQQRSDPSGRWHSMNITPQLAWSSIPVAKRRADGSEFKMLHVMATRGDRARLRKSEEDDQ